MGVCKSIINKKEDKQRYNDIMNPSYNNVQQNYNPNYQEKINNTNKPIQYNNPQGQIYNGQYNPYEFNPAPVYNIQNPQFNQFNQFNDKNNNNLQYQKTNNDNNSNNIDLNQFVDIEKKN